LLSLPSRAANNLADISALEHELKALEARLEKEYGQQLTSQLPKMAAWREAYRIFGVKAKDYPSSVEALYKRVTKGGSVAGINQSHR
jgi:DNA/RNA-binding domain of Phe-tRNA-synthetase-like protein